MTTESPKSSNRSVVACDGESKRFFKKIQSQYMRRRGANVSQEKIVAALIAKAGLTVQDMLRADEFANVIAETKAA